MQVEREGKTGIRWLSSGRLTPARYTPAIQEFRRRRHPFDLGLGHVPPSHCFFFLVWMAILFQSCCWESGAPLLPKLITGVGTGERRRCMDHLVSFRLTFFNSSLCILDSFKMIQFWGLIQSIEVKITDKAERSIASN